MGEVNEGNETGKPSAEELDAAAAEQAFFDAMQFAEHNHASARPGQYCRCVSCQRHAERV